MKGYETEELKARRVANLTAERKAADRKGNEGLVAKIDRELVLYGGGEKPSKRGKGKGQSVPVELEPVEETQLAEAASEPEAEEPQPE